MPYRVTRGTTHFPVNQLSLDAYLNTRFLDIGMKEKNEKRMKNS